MILNESLPNITQEDIEAWNNSSNEEHKDMLPKILAKFKQDGLGNIFQKLLRNFNMFGIDPKKNPMINVLSNLEFVPQKKHAENFNHLTDLQEEGIAQLPKDFYELESLYDRPLKDFDYTVKIFELLNNRKELSKYFIDTTDVTVDKFYDENGNIKPAGIGKTEDENTIYGMIELLAIDNEPDTDKYSFSAYDVLRRFGLSEQSMFKALKKLFEKYGKEAGIPNIDKYIDIFDNYDNIVEKTKYKGGKRRNYNAEEAKLLRDTAYNILHTPITNIPGDKVELVLRMKDFIDTMSRK